MEMCIYGYAGLPLIVFPTSMGRFNQYADMGMIAATEWEYDQGLMQAFCVDSVDEESWYNKGVSPYVRMQRHLQYERYILHEVLPLVRHRNGSPQLAVAGCSFGGFHSVLFALRHPDVVTHCLSFGGAFDIKQFLNGYYDDNAYYLNAPDFLPGLNDSWFWEKYQHIKFVLATGEEDICLAENLRLSGIMSSKSIPHQLDVWGDGAGHDWPWWRAMARKFF